MKRKALIVSAPRGRMCDSVRSERGEKSSGSDSLRKISFPSVATCGGVARKVWCEVMAKRRVGRDRAGRFAVRKDILVDFVADVSSVAAPDSLFGELGLCLERSWKVVKGVEFVPVSESARPARFVQLLPRRVGRVLLMANASRTGRSHHAARSCS